MDYFYVNKFYGKQTRFSLAESTQLQMCGTAQSNDGNDKKMGSVMGMNAFPARA